MAKKRKEEAGSLKKYYDESILKTGSKKTPIKDWTDQRKYSQKEMMSAEENRKKYNGDKGED